MGKKTAKKTVKKTGSAKAASKTTNLVEALGADMQCRRICGWLDRRRIRTVQDLIDLIAKVGERWYTHIKVPLQGGTHRRMDLTEQEYLVKCIKDKLKVDIHAPGSN